LKQQRVVGQKFLYNRTTYYGHDGTNKMAKGMIIQTPELLKETFLLTYADSGGE
jgi:hypothetical protein